MSYGAAVFDVTQSYKDDPELRRRIEQMRLDASRAPAPDQGDGLALQIARQRAAKEAQDAVIAGASPRSLPERVMRTALATPMALAGAALTAPGRIYEGVNKQLNEGLSREEQVDLATDIAGNVTLGARAVGGAPAGSLAAGGAKSGPHWNELSKIRSELPYDRMSYGATRSEELLPAKTISPEDLQGSYLVPAVGDRTRAGEVLHTINDQPLAYPVSLEGGPNYMRAGAAQGPDKSVWASEKGQVQGLNRRIREGLETGRPVDFMYTSMGARSGDFSHHNADALLAQVPGAGIDVQALMDFDKLMREKHPNWAGVQNVDAAHEQLYAKGSAKLRTDFVKEMDKTRWQTQGFPSVASTRLATSEGSLVGQPPGVSGLTVSRFTDAPTTVLDPAIKHSTYPTQLGGGSYIGGLEAPVPRDIAWPSWAESRKQQGLSTYGPQADRSMFMSDVSQVADQKWVDDMMTYLHSVRRGR